MSNRKASPTEPCGEFEPMSEELARIIADATKPDCELEPMTPELSRLVDEVLAKLDCELEPMTPELSRLVDEVLYPDRRRAITTMPHRPPKRRKTKRAA